MRIYPVAYSPVRNYQKANVKVQRNETQVQQNPNFKGWGGAFGTFFGTCAGVALTAMTGGALAWTIPVLGGTGAIGGDMYVEKDRPQTDSFGQ